MHLLVDGCSQTEYLSSTDKKVAKTGYVQTNKQYLYSQGLILISMVDNPSCNLTNFMGKTSLLLS